MVSAELPSNTDVAGLLRSQGAPAVCYALSDTPNLDGREMSAAEAVSAAEMGGWGTLISCVPGRLAYFCDELGTRRFIQERPGTPTL